MKLWDTSLSLKRLSQFQRVLPGDYCRHSSKDVQAPRPQPASIFSNSSLSLEFSVEAQVLMNMLVEMEQALVHRDCAKAYSILLEAEQSLLRLQQELIRFQSEIRKPAA